jgi:hypothetical protein
LTSSNLNASSLTTGNINAGNITCSNISLTLLTFTNISSAGLVSSSGKTIVKYPLALSTVKTNVSTSGGSTLTADSFLNGFINRSGLANNSQTDTLPSGNDIVTQLNTFTTATTGMTLDCFYYNSTNNNINIVAGSGGTLSGSAQLSGGTLHRITLILTGVSSYVGMVL